MSKSNGLLPGMPLECLSDQNNLLKIKEIDAK